MINIDNFNDFILEMAIPNKDIINKTWYHGTNEKSGILLEKDRFLRPSTIVNNKTRRFLAPINDRVYLTNKLYHAVEYAILRSKPNEHPYLISVDGKDLVDVLPDEDTIADILCGDGIENNWLRDLAKRVSPNLYHKYITRGDYSYGTQIGKKIVKYYLTDPQIVKIINSNLKLSNFGPIPIKNIYKLPIEIRNVNRADLMSHKDLLPKSTTAKVYFCDAYSPWQKPLIEKANSMIHRIYPKNADIKQLTKSQLQAIENKLNDLPRKILGYLTPNEVWNKKLEVA